MKVIYFADMMGDIEEEKRFIQRELTRYGMPIDFVSSIESTDTPPNDMKFDVMFFDWGGMSIGNSLMDHFCERWINDARENPSRIYIMTSHFTKNAMADALNYFDHETEEVPANIYLSIKNAVPYLKALLEIEKINQMSHLEMCRLWRGAPVGHPYFDTTLPYNDVFEKRLYKHFGGFTPEISKQLSGES